MGHYYSDMCCDYCGAVGRCRPNCNPAATREADAFRAALQEKLAEVQRWLGEAAATLSDAAKEKLSDEHPELSYLTSRAVTNDAAEADNRRKF